MAGCGARTPLDIPNEISSSASPTSRPFALSAGDSFTCALLSSGTAKCWGDSNSGELGDGKLAESKRCPLRAPAWREQDPCEPSPVSVAGLTGAVALSVGWGGGCALIANGTPACWGDDEYGELGLGTTTGPTRCRWPGSDIACSQTPVPVPGLATATAIARGGATACALLADGTVDCWGDNTYGQVGSATTTTGPGATKPWPFPTEVPGLTDVTAIAVGETGSCALLADGTLDCWGDNSHGQLGIGTAVGPSSCYPGSSSCSTAPLPVPGLAGVTAVAYGGSFVCALLSDRTVDCWGDNTFGQLGNGTKADLARPKPVTNLGHVMAVSTGSTHACALLEDRTVTCWGDPWSGHDVLTTPTSVVGLEGVAAVAAGNTHTCALLLDGGVRCWGVNSFGEFGDGTTNDSPTDVPVAVVW